MCSHLLSALADALTSEPAGHRLHDGGYCVKFLDGGVGWVEDVLLVLVPKEDIGH